jgi:hypothetical protein
MMLTALSVELPQALINVAMAEPAIAPAHCQTSSQE